MELAEIFRILWSRKLLTGLVVILAVGAAVAARLSVSSVPSGAATVQILVDSPDSALANLSTETMPLTTRASVFAQVMTSQAVLEPIAAAAGVPTSEITAQGPYSGSGQALNTVTPSPARGNQLIAEKTKYKITFVAQANEPVVTASVQGPNADAAARVAASIYPGVQKYVASLQKQSATPAANRVTIRELGPPQAGAVNSSSRTTFMVAGFLGVLILGLLALLVVEGVRRHTDDEDPFEQELLADFPQVSVHPRARAATDELPPSAYGIGAAPSDRRS